MRYTCIQHDLLIDETAEKYQWTKKLCPVIDGGHEQLFYELKQENNWWLLQMLLFHYLSVKIFYQFMILGLGGCKYYWWVAGCIRQLDMKNQTVIKAHILKQEIYWKCCRSYERSWTLRWLCAPSYIGSLNFWSGTLCRLVLVKPCSGSAGFLLTLDFWSKLFFFFLFLV